VKSLDDAIPAFVAYYASHPPRWEPTDEAGCVITGPASQGRAATRFSKLTDFALLRVEQQQPGQWVASRDGYPLAQLAQSGVELGSCFVAAGESNQGLGCLLGADFGM